MKYIPRYDAEFNPMICALEKFRKDVAISSHKTLSICVERNKGYNYIHTMEIFADGSKEHNEANYGVAERIVKSILWVAGGYKIYVLGDDYIYNALKAAYTEDGARAFDVGFMSNVYERNFEVVKTNAETFPKENNCSLAIGGHLKGCRIGFDAGGSDRKGSAVIDGKVVYSEEVAWSPKLNSAYRYPREGIKAAFLTAASKMPRVDAIGVSSAGVYIDN